VRGALEQLMPFEEEVEVFSGSENTAWFVSVGASDALLDEVRRRARELELDIFSDTSDRVAIRRKVHVPHIGFGHFELMAVPESYFGVRDQAMATSDLGRGHSDYLRGLSFEMLGRPEAALPHLERAVRQSNDDGEMNMALGRVLLRTENAARAVVFLRRACASLDDVAEPHHTLGVALTELSQLDRAREAFGKAIEVAPDEPSLLVSFARACVETAHYQQARPAIERALKLEPGNAEAHATMAVLCHRTGERTSAIQHAREAITLKPDDDTIRQLLNLLDENTNQGNG
jgi:Flp pilus assembly protein TadD